MRGVPSRSPSETQSVYVPGLIVGTRVSFAKFPILLTTVYTHTPSLICGISPRNPAMQRDESETGFSTPRPDSGYLTMTETPSGITVTE